MEPTQAQLEIVNRPLDHKIFLEGPAGTGKTTVGTNRLAHLIESGVDHASILVMIPQRTLALPYYDLLSEPDLAAGGRVDILTLGGLSLSAVELFWPLVAGQYKFKAPQQRPTFLSLETAQYHMARVVGPVIDREGYFDTVTIERNRLYSQLIDNLNKAAVVGFSYREIGSKLKSAWSGSDPAQTKVYDDVQRCVELFRTYCLEHNLVDFSLQVEMFMQHLWRSEHYQNYLRARYKHLIVDNIEEDTPTTHDLILDLLTHVESALIIYDTQAGYRRFLGADPDSAYIVRRACDQQVIFHESFVSNVEVESFGLEIAQSLDIPQPKPAVDPRERLIYVSFKYHPQMIDGVADEIRALVEDDGVPPNEIVVLSPYLSDALRFSLMNRLEAMKIPVRSHRPSRSLREEPAALAMLTLAQLAHPQWKNSPRKYDIVYMLMETIADLDLVRAQLLGYEGLNTRDGMHALQPFDRIKPGTQSRITFVLGERFDRLRTWIEDYIKFTENTHTPLTLDHFFSRLFGEVLSQPGFGFHDDFDAAEVAANLIDSARKFRQIIGDIPLDGKTIGQEYVEMVSQGIIADQYLRSWAVQSEEAVLLAPAYTFLMTNRPVSYQFWLNVGGYGWSERLYQPLTNPYVLTRNWQEGHKWTDDDEVDVSKEALFRLTMGLARRCRERIYLGFSELGEQGYEQRGELLGAVQRMLRRLANEQ